MIAFEFTCPSCSYGHHGAGCRSALMSGPTWSIVCLDCKELQDVIVWEPHDQPDPEDETMPTKPMCGEDPEHRVEEWAHPGPCPKCGTTMDRNEDLVCMAD